MFLQGNAPPGQEEVIRGTGSGLLAAGSDTVRASQSSVPFGPKAHHGILQTVTALHMFFLAMVLFPEAQRKAQEELDEVVGLNRLPEYKDSESLPYINAVCKEVLRWHPISPSGIAHRVTRDDIFEGYFIPAGTIVVGNAT